MPFVAAKCTSCGGSLTVDKSKEAGICPYCGQPYIMEKAINYYNTTNVTNIDTIKADVVNIESSDSASNLIRNGETLIGFEDWAGAGVVFTKVTQMYPHEWRGWYGLIRVNTTDFKRYTKNYERHIYLVSLFEKLKATAGSSSPEVARAKEYLKKDYELAKKAVACEYEAKSQIIDPALAEANAKVNRDIPLEVKTVKTVASKVILIAYICWIVLAAIATIVITNKVLAADDGYGVLKLDVSFFRFVNMDQREDITMFISVVMLILQVALSLVFFLIGIVGIFVQIASKQKRKTAFVFFSAAFAIVTVIHLLYYLLASSSIDDPGYFFSYSGTYRYIETLTINSKATVTEAMRISLKLAWYYGVLNYLLVATPMLITELIGNKKRKAIKINCENKKTCDNLEEEKCQANQKYRIEMSTIESLKHSYMD